MQHARWSRERWFDLVFVIGFGFKALDGLAELVAGLPLLVLRAAQIEAITRTATAGELREDPSDLAAHLLRHGAATLSTEVSVLAGLYLVVHGLVKVGIVVAVFRGSRRLYPWAIAALSGFAVWQAVVFVQRPTVGFGLLTLFDVVIVALTVREWRHHRGLGAAVRSVLGTGPRRPSVVPREADTVR